jgi:hypothetical protein
MIDTLKWTLDNLTSMIVFDAVFIISNSQTISWPPAARRPLCLSNHERLSIIKVIALSAESFVSNSSSLSILLYPFDPRPDASSVGRLGVRSVAVILSGLSRGSSDYCSSQLLRGPCLSERLLGWRATPLFHTSAGQCFHSGVLGRGRQLHSRPLGPP